MILLTNSPPLLQCAIFDLLPDQPTLAFALKSRRNLSDIVQCCEYWAIASSRGGLNKIRESLDQRFGDAADIDAVVSYVDSRLVVPSGFGPTILMSRYRTINNPSI